MNNFQGSDEQTLGKVTLIRIIIVATILPLLFFFAIELWDLAGLRVYVLQLGLYIVFYLLAFWGMSREGISLPINTRLIWQALEWALVGWAFYVLTIHLLGMVKWADEYHILRSVPAGKIWAQILSTWFFVGLGEEILFRGYFLAGFRRYFTIGTSHRRTILAGFLTSVFFSLWHLPVRISWLLSGELDVTTVIISLVMLFLLGTGFAYLFVQTRNIVLVGLVHGVMNYSLIGLDTQLSTIILLVCIGRIVLFRLAPSFRANAPA